MEISEPDRRLMRWRLLHGELHLQVVYKKKIVNTQEDALCRLQTLGDTVTPVDEEIP